MSSEGTPLHGDRSAWNVMDFDTEHAKDIMDSTLRRHLPLPGAAGGLAQSDGTDWQRVNSIALADLPDYTINFIIVGGASDWEAAAFDWDTMAAGAGADMVHSHTSNAEGGTIAVAAISDIAATYLKLDASNDPLTSALDLNFENTTAGGDAGFQAFTHQVDGTGMTGTLRGAYITASGGSAANTGTIRGIEIKGRAGRPGETGNDVAVLEGFSVSSDAKTYDVTVHRGGEIILDGGAGTSTLAVGLRIANNFQADRATTSYGLQIYRDSFDYTADIQLSYGHTIADGANIITLDTGLFVSGATADESMLILQTTDDDATNPLTDWQDSAGASLLQVLSDGDIKTDRWLTQDNNTFIGVNVAGDGNLAHTTGSEGYYNTIIGWNSGQAITTGRFNTIVGANTAISLTTGRSNVILGVNAALAMTTGYSNFALGGGALESTTSGHSNVAIGINTLQENTTAHSNVAIGVGALTDTVTGRYNVAVGKGALAALTGAAEKNVAIGTEAGAANNAAATGNVYIGYRAALNETTSNKLYIENSASVTPLIYGEFDNNLIRLNADTALTNAVHNLFQLRHLTSGTAVAGLGVGIEFQLEENDGTNRIAAYITADWQDAGEGASADGRLNFGVMTADAAAATALSIWNGKVGIKTTTPGAGIDVVDDYSHFGDPSGTAYFYNNTLNFNNSVDATSLGYINYVGYNHGATQFRNLAICNGKNATFAFFEGSTGRFGVGVTDPDTRVEILYAGDQLKLSFDGTDNAVFAVDTAGDLTITASGDEIKVADWVRHTSASYRRYYHLSVGGFDPGASGATWTDPDANHTGGWRLTTAGHTLIAGTDVHADWDGASDLVVEIYFALNAAGSGGDTVDLRLVAYYNGIGDTATKTQTVEVATATDGTQFKVYRADFVINYDETNNVVDAGDNITFILNLETDTSEIDDIIALHGGFYYNTTHLGIESGDV